MDLTSISETRMFGSGFVWSENGYILSCDGLEVPFFMRGGTLTDVEITPVEMSDRDLLEASCVSFTHFE